MPVTSKITISTYIFTCQFPLLQHDFRYYLLTKDYAIVSGMLFATVKYVIVGLFNSSIDHIYFESWGSEFPWSSYSTVLLRSH